MCRLFFTISLLSLLFARPAQAHPSQTAPPQPAAPSLSDHARISLLTILPGEGPASAFGHSALRVRDPVLGLDRTYNYGTYDFSDPYFIPKFVYGQLTYVLSTSSFRRLLRRYRYLERPVIEQELNLSPSQEQRLFQFLEWNAQPQHRAYQYDFLFDNCSTRPRDALRRVLGDSLHLERATLPRRTFRHHLDRFVADKPLLDLGFDLGLGLPTDRVATPREAMFLPEYLMEGFAGATLTSASSSDRAQAPLVTRTDTLFWVTGAQFPARPAFPWPTVVLWLLFAVLLGTTVWRTWQHAPPLTWPDVVLFGLTGVAGVVIWFLAFLSEHAVTRYNFNAAWALPTHLALAVTLAMRRGGPLTRGYLLICGGIALVLAIGWSFWPQDLHTAALPLVLMLALRSGRRALFSQQSSAPGQSPASRQG